MAVALKTPIKINRGLNYISRVVLLEKLSLSASMIFGSHEVMVAMKGVKL